MEGAWRPVLPPAGGDCVHSNCECALESLAKLEVHAYYAVKDHNLMKLERLMQSGIDMNHIFSDSFVPSDARHGSLLQLIVQENFVDAAKLAFRSYSAGFLKETNIQTALMYAMRYNFICIVRIIIQAALVGNIDMDLSSAFRHAMYKKQYDLVAGIIGKPGFDVNLEASWGRDKPLHVVVHHEQTDLVDQLLKHGAFIDAKDRKGTTPLIVACSLSSVKCVKMLVKHGADPNIKSYSEIYPDYSPLHAAFRFSKSVEETQLVIDTLIACGLDLNKESWVLSHLPGNPELVSLHSCLKQLYKSPMSLKMMCFVKVRSIIKIQSNGMSLLHLIYSLPIPPTLKKYLAIDS